MSQLTLKSRNLLDKLYNLRGEDSVILAKKNKVKKDASEVLQKAKEEKGRLISDISKLKEEEQMLNNEGNCLLIALGNINGDTFKNVLDELEIEFNPNDLYSKIKKLLPKKIEEIVSENEKFSNILKDIDVEIENATAKIEEAGLRIDEALSNQTRLNSFFDMILSGNINITRDEITTLLEKLDFDKDEQKEVAKLLMFPEDGLYEYDSSVKNGGFSNNDIDLKDTSVLSVPDKNKIMYNEATKHSAGNHILDDENRSKEFDDIKSSVAVDKISDIFDRIVAKNMELKSSIYSLEDNKEGNVAEKKLEETTPMLSEKLDALLIDVGLNRDEFTAGDYKKILDNFDENVIRENIGVLKEYGFDLDVVRENACLLYDKELKDKILRLLDIGKEPRDICLVPTVLTKYDLMGLNNTINVFQISGLDPRKVPLLAY